MVCTAFQCLFQLRHIFSGNQEFFAVLQYCGKPAFQRRLDLLYLHQVQERGFGFPQEIFFSQDFFHFVQLLSCFIHLFGNRRDRFYCQWIQCNECRKSEFRTTFSRWCRSGFPASCCGPPGWRRPVLRYTRLIYITCSFLYG